MSDEAVHKWFEGIWADREDRIYPQLFGKLNPEIHTIPASTFASLAGGEPGPQMQVDPRFLTHGVLESPPNEQRGHWLYVTSGMSNPWGESPETAKPDGGGGYSGLGFEFVVEAREQTRWPILLLQWLMAVQLLVASGQMQGELLAPHDRIPLGGPLAKKDGVLTHVLVVTPGEAGDAIGYPESFQLASGKVDLLLMLGISSREADFTRTQGAAALVKLLQHHEIFPLTDPERVSVI